jgi:hypothetical protein
MLDFNTQIYFLENNNIESGVFIKLRSCVNLFILKTIKHTQIEPC